MGCCVIFYTLCYPLWVQELEQHYVEFIRPTSAQFADSDVLFLGFEGGPVNKPSDIRKAEWESRSGEAEVYSSPNFMRKLVASVVLVHRPSRTRYAGADDHSSRTAERHYVEENVLSAGNFLRDECIGWHDHLAVDGAFPVWWTRLIFPIVFRFKST